MRSLSKLILLFAPLAFGQTYYNKTTIPPTIAAHTVLGNSTNATAVPGQLTSIPASVVPVYSGDCGNAIASSVLVCTQAAGNFNVVGTLSAGTFSPSSLTIAGVTLQGTSNSTSAPWVLWNNTTGDTNYKAWNCHANSTGANGTFACGTQTVNAAGEHNWVTVTRGGANPYDIFDVSFGSAGTSNNTTNFLGTGLVSMAGALTVTGVLTGGTVNATTLTSQPTAAATSDAGNVPFTLIRSGVPFIIDQCSIDSSGTLSSCTSLPLTYGKAYMYFNASILAAASTGSTAGFYAVNMTGATAGQVCSPITLYASGSPSVPGTCNTFTPNATGTQTPPNTQITEANISMPAHSMGLNGGLECKGSYSQLSSAGTKSHVIKWGTATTTNTPTTIAQSYVTILISNAGSESAQNFQNVSSSTTAVTMQDSAPGVSSVNTASAQTVGFFDTLNTPATDFSVLSLYSCVVSPN